MLITPVVNYQNTQDPQSWISDMNSQEMANQLNNRLLGLLNEREQLSSNAASIENSE